MHVSRWFLPAVWTKGVEECITHDHCYWLLVNATFTHVHALFADDSCKQSENERNYTWMNLFTVHHCHQCRRWHYDFPDDDSRYCSSCCVQLCTCLIEDVIRASSYFWHWCCVCIMRLFSSDPGVDCGCISFVRIHFRARPKNSSPEYRWLVILLKSRCLGEQITDKLLTILILQNMFMFIVASLVRTLFWKEDEDLGQCQQSSQPRLLCHHPFWQQVYCDNILASRAAGVQGM